MEDAARTTVGDVGAGHNLGRYELLLPIAKGGMAVVFAARMRGTRGFQKIVAVKTIRSEMTEDPQFEQMFLDEASLASKIRHPHVVEILDLGEDKGVLYLVMEWIDGEPLHVILKEAANKGGVPLPVAVRVTSHLAAGLHAAHELRDDAGKLYAVVHRDISPQNVLVTDEGVAKLVDFGVAKAKGRSGGETAAGQVKGKVSYMAPEQATGGTVDRRSDIFSLGIVLYMMTTGKHPFRRENDAATLMNICSNARAYRPSKLVPGYPPKLEMVVMQAIEKDPVKRFPTANDMLRALDQALPASMRASTDEEVASFIRGLVGHRLDKRRAAIREALVLADDRKSPTVRPPRLMDADASASGMTPLSAVTASKVLEKSEGAEEQSESSSERWTFDGPPSSNGVEQTGPSLSSAVNSAPLLLPPNLPKNERKRVSPATWIALAALVVAAVSGIAVVVMVQSRAPASPIVVVASASPEPRAPEPTSTPEPTSAPEPSAPPTASDPVAVDSSTPPSPAGTKPPTHPNVPTASTKPRSTSAATKTGKPPATPTPPSTLPQIRDPGF